MFKPRGTHLGVQSKIDNKIRMAIPTEVLFKRKKVIEEEEDEEKEKEKERMRQAAAGHTGMGRS